MKLCLLFVAAMVLVACTDKQAAADAEAKAHHEKLYRVPPPSERPKDKGF